MKLTVDYKGKNITIKDICMQPMAPDNDACVIFSPLQYWQFNTTNLNKCFTDMGDDCYIPDPFGDPAEDWHDQFLYCTRLVVPQG